MPRTQGDNAEDTRARILRTALELISEHGYSGTSMRDLAQRLDLTKAAIYYYFSSKEELLDALVSPVSDGFAELASRAREGTQTPEQLLRELALLWSGQDVRQLLALLSDPSVLRLVRSRVDLFIFHEQLIRAVAGDGDSSADLRARCAVGAVQGAVLSSSRAHLLPHPDEPWAGLEAAEIDQIVACSLAALAAPTTAVPD